MRLNADVIAGLITASFGIFVIYEALELPYRSEFGPGPGFFPLWVGIGVVACSGFMISTRVAQAAGGEGQAETFFPGMRRSLGAWLAFAISLLLVPRAGFVLSFMLLTAFLILALERRSAWTAVGLALCLALGFYLIFTVALGVSLPTGPWGF